MMYKTATGRWALAVVAMLAAAGCQSGGSGSKQQGSQPLPKQPAEYAKALDPCAERLHDVCGSLLMYYMTYHRLPERLEDLERAGNTVPLECPASHKPYAYNRNGLEIKDIPGRVVLYDAEPVHGPWRWSITVEADMTGPLVTRVVPVPEQSFEKAKENVAGK